MHFLKSFSLFKNFTPMPIRMFESYGHENILQKLPISTIENTIVAIDGFWYLKKYLPLYNEKEFLNISIGIESMMKNLIELSKKTSILWIWDGLEFIQLHPTDLTKTSLDNSDKIINTRSFSKKLYDQEIFVNLINVELKKIGVVVIRAPYSAAAQCCYFMKTCKINAFSKNDALLFADCDKLIIDFDYQNSTYDIIDRNKLFEECKLNLESFRRVALLSGCEYCPTHPSFAAEFDPIKVIELMKKNTKSDESLKYYGISPESKYYTEYLQAFSMIENRPVMCMDGTVQLSNQNSPAENIENIFGKKLSNKVYQNIFKCNIGIKALGIDIYNRKKPYIVDKILDLFKTVIEQPKSIDASKMTKCSELILSKLNLKIDFNPSFNKAIQILFSIFSNEEFLQKFLIKFLNSGTLKTKEQKFGEHLPIRDRIVHFSTYYSADILENFNMFLENCMLFEDTIEMIKNQYNLENDLGFVFSYADFIAEIEKPVIKEFISKNINDSIKLNEFTEVLEKI